MPAKSGFSHALGGLLILISEPVVEALVTWLVEQYGVPTVLVRLGESVVTHSIVPESTDAATAIPTLVILFGLVFLWGFGYHLARHGTRQNETAEDRFRV